MARGIKQTIPPRKREKWYYATEAARLLSVTTETVRLWRISGRIRAEIMPNGRWGFPESEIERLTQPIPREEYIRSLCDPGRDTSTRLKPDKKG